MSQFYLTKSGQKNPWHLTECEVFQLTAREVAERDEDMIYNYMKRHEFRLASMNSQVRDKMFSTMIEEQDITGGWFYWFCLPGCMPDSEPFGPFESAASAMADARKQHADDFEGEE